MAEPGGLPSMGSRRVGDDWSDLAAAAAAELFNFSFFGISDWGIDLDYCDVEWFALEMNQDHSVIFEIAPNYCISDSFVDSEGYSISSKGFLPTVVDIMAIWIKFTHSSPFLFTDS